MILRRLGNKKKIAQEIQKFFPKHITYIEPFFGSGGMFFNKPKAKYNIVNDLDSDVFNLFQVVINKKEELEKAFYMMPIHSDLLDYWKIHKEVDPLKRALRFLFLSNFLLYGNNGSIRHQVSSGAGGVKGFKDNFKSMLEITFDKLYDVNFRNWDFEKFITTLSFANGRNDEDKTFIYCDPPYLETNDNYSDSFLQKDHIRLIDVLLDRGCPFAISEFNSDFVIENAKERGLNVHIIGERQNLKNRRTEILITNYKNEATLFD